MEPKYPTESESQRIGKLAQAAFEATRPLTWQVLPMDGDNDFGLDYHIQITDKGAVKYTFCIQLKGSKSNPMKQSGQFSVPLKTTTLNFYRNITEPVLLVYADLSTNDNPRLCSVYFHWVHDEIRKQLGGEEYFSSEQASHTFHVPASNQLTETSHMEILEYLHEHVKKMRAVDALHIEISEKAPGRESDVYQGIREQIKSGETFLGSTLSESQFPWMVSPEGSVAYQLKAVHDKLEYSDDKGAIKLLTSISDLADEVSDHENAEYHYQSGRVALIQNRKIEACEEFQTSHSLMPHEERYLIGWLETRLSLTGDEGDQNELRDIWTLVPESETKEVLYLKSIVQSLLGNYEEGLELLDSLEIRDAAIAKSKIYLLQGMWDELICYCSIVLNREDLKDRDNRLIRMFLARALFIQAYGLVGKPHPIRVPPYGTPDMDVDMVKKTWGVLCESLDQMKAAGWPVAVEYLLDMVTITAQTLGKAYEVLPLLKDLARARPYLDTVNHCLGQVAIIAGDRCTAIQAFERVSEEEEVVCKTLLTFYEMHQKNKVIEIGEKLLTYPGECELYPVCIGVAEICCDDLLHPDERKLFVEKLLSNPDWQDVLSISKYIRDVRDPLQSGNALINLKRAYKDYPASRIIASHLFMTLDATNREAAAQCAELAKDIQVYRALGFDEILHLGQVFLTLERWDDAIATADQAILQYADKTRLHVLRALALDKKGETAEALVSLKEVLKQDVYDPVAVEQYIRIASRCGLVDEAKELVRKLYGESKTREDKLDALKLMFNLEFKSNPNSSALKDIAFKVGELVNQEDEDEEGIYLQFFFAATMGDGEGDSDPSQVTAFQYRLKTFTALFPGSSLLRQVEAPEDGEGILKKLRELTGMTPDILAHYEKNKQSIRKGEMAAPYIWRPRLLPSIRDVVHLWDIAKLSNKDATEYHLLMATPDREMVDIQNGIGIPLFDLPTLVLLEDLSLLENMIEQFGKVAVPKFVITELANLSHPFSGTFNINLVDRVLSVLQKYFSRVLQPGEVSEEMFTQGPIAKTEELKKIYMTGDYTLYSDDAVFRMYLTAELPELQSICTLDVLELLEAKSVLDCHDVARVIANLCRWNVGIVVQQRHFLAAIPDGIASCSDSENMLGLLKRSDDFVCLANAVWDFKLEYAGLVRHMAYLLSYLSCEGTERADIISSIWQLWVEKVQFNEKLGAPQLKHLAMSFVLAGSFMQGCKKEDMALLWSAYKDAAEKILGVSANDESMGKAFLDIAVSVAEMANRESGAIKSPSGIETSELGGVIIETISSGLNENAQDYKDFMKAYSDKRIESLANQRGRG